MSTQSFLPAATLHAPKSRQAKLRNAIERGATVELVDNEGNRVSAPELELVLQLALRTLANGDDVVVLAGNTELSPAEAGKVLGLSRQYVDRLIDLGDIPARTLPRSSHRRIRVADLAIYQGRSRQSRKRIAHAVNELIDAGATY